MLSKNQIKFIRSLYHKKFRTESGLFITEGVKTVDELLLSSFKIHSIYATKEWIQKHKGEKKRFQYTEYPVNEVSELELEKISMLTTANEVLALVHLQHYSADFTEIVQSLSLALDTIQDPGNLGTILRIADWFGIKYIICSENSVDVFNPKTVQASMGAVFKVKTHYAGLPLFFGELKRKFRNTAVCGALLNGENIYTKNLPEQGIILLGNESQGISPELLPYINHKIKIPPAVSSETESLNIAIAAAVICSEFKRHQWIKAK